MKVQVQDYAPISTPYELVTTLRFLNSKSSKNRRSTRVVVPVCYYPNQRISSSQQTEVVSLLDYGAGNVRSIRNAIHHLGYQIHEVKCAADIKNAKHLIFPGVGAFGTAMDSIRKQGLADALCDYILQDKHFLGICLGLQLLFESSEEKGNVQGLGIIPGIVRKFDSSEMVKVPHIGWNQLNIKRPSKLLKQVHGQHVYFVHSYRALASPANRDWQLATCNHGGEFIAAVKKGNVHAVQFHPEKSGVVGMGILQQFLEGDQSAIEEVEEESIQSYGSTSRLAKRVIACLDVRSNEKGDLVVTKGDQYDVRDKSDNREVRNLGKPVELASRYYEEGADEVAFLNITGFRDFPLADIPMLEVLQRTSGEVFVPLTVGGGIRDFKDKDGRQYSSLEVAAEYFRSGADKISIGSDAVYAAEEYLKTGVKSGRSSLEKISCVYGNQAVVVSIDPRRVYVSGSEEVPFKTIKVNDLGPNGEEYVWYQCTVNGGREGRPIGAYELAQAVEELGAGEILLNCINCDGQGHGFDLELVNLISDAVGIPVIASSGAGSEKHFSEVFLSTAASAALAAGIFHRQEVKIGDVKEHLRAKGIEVRCCTKEYATVAA